MTYFAYISLEADDKILVFTLDPNTGKLTQTTAPQSFPPSNG